MTLDVEKFRKVQALARSGVTVQASPVEAHRIEALAIWTELTKRKPGNPTGRNQHS